MKIFITLRKSNLSSPKLRRLVFKTMALICCVGILSNCTSKSWVTRYRVTLNVSDNGVIRSASNVYKWHCREAIKFWGSMDSGSCRLKGEALALDLKDKGHIFMLLTNLGDVVAQKKPGTIMSDPKTNAPISWQVEGDRSPIFVRFADIKDPKTVQQVHFSDFEEFGHSEKVRTSPYVADQRTITKAIPSNAGARLGGNVLLVSIHVEHTKDRVTSWKLIKVLPWLWFKNRSMNLSGGLGSSKGLGTTLADEIQIIDLVGER